jgi:penicillin-binding protein 1C
MSAHRARSFLRRHSVGLIIAGMAAVAVPVGGFAVLDGVYPLDLREAGEVSTVVTDREGRMLRAFTTRAGTWRLAAAPEDVSPLYLEMLVAYEDRRFHRHPGIDPLAIGRALLQWAQHGRPVSGASTLTMQAARLLAPGPRGWRSKLVQAFRALQLERALSKREILALYIRRAPMGGNIEGVRAASLAWFGKEPRRLTAGEAALLVALPQSPAAVRPDRHPARARSARDKVLTVLERRGVLTARSAREARSEPIPLLRRNLPFRAPHAAEVARAGAPRSATLGTTLDLALQESIEALLHDEAAGLAPEANIAVLVADHRSAEIRAYAGSADFFAARRHGQVDMMQAIRSPGSALKPFIYGMGFDLGLIHPETILRDAPRRFGDYQPENFQRNYMGDVSVRAALQHSLNVPAVAVLEAIGPERFVSRLRHAGITLRFDGAVERPGLPVALGGTGLSLLDLVTLYAALGNDGMVRPLRLYAGAAAGPGQRLVGPAAAWHLARILDSAPPPADAVPRHLTTRSAAFSFKTGTSYGFRDAWAVGYDGGHVIGVWVGRPDGTPSPDRFGRNTAAPLLFKLFDLLPERRAGQAPRAIASRPPGVLEGATEDLPPALRRFDGLASGHAARAGVPVTISFPPAGATVGLERKPGRSLMMALMAEGGRHPLRWIVNGQPLAAPTMRQRAAFWPVDGEGFVSVTVIDADGRSAVAEARIKIY